MNEIEAKVIELIVDKLGVDASEVTPSANFASDLGADSRHRRTHDGFRKGI